MARLSRVNEEEDADLSKKVFTGAICPVKQKKNVSVKHEAVTVADPWFLN